jgi:hypothetical protein
MPEITNINAKELAKQQHEAAVERMRAFERSEFFPFFVEEMNKIEQMVMSRAASGSDGNLDTKTIGILRGLAYAKNPSKFVV